MISYFVWITQISESLIFRILRFQRPLIIVMNAHDEATQFKQNSAINADPFVIYFK